MPRRSRKAPLSASVEREVQRHAPRAPAGAPSGRWRAAAPRARPGRACRAAIRAARRGPAAAGSPPRPRSRPSLRPRSSKSSTTMSSAGTLAGGWLEQAFDRGHLGLRHRQPLQPGDDPAGRRVAARRPVLDVAGQLVGLQAGLPPRLGSSAPWLAQRGLHVRQEARCPSAARRRAAGWPAAGSRRPVPRRRAPLRSASACQASRSTRPRFSDRLHARGRQRRQRVAAPPMLPRSTRGCGPDRSRWNCAFSSVAELELQAVAAPVVARRRPAATAAGAAAARVAASGLASGAGRSSCRPTRLLCSSSSRRAVGHGQRAAPGGLAAQQAADARQRRRLRRAAQRLGRGRALGAEAQRCRRRRCCLRSWCRRRAARALSGRTAKPCGEKSTLPRAPSSGGMSGCTRRSLPASCRLPRSVAACAAGQRDAGASFSSLGPFTLIVLQRRADARPSGASAHEAQQVGGRAAALPVQRQQRSAVPPGRRCRPARRAARSPRAAPAGGAGSCARRSNSISPLACCDRRPGRDEGRLAAFGRAAGQVGVDQVAHLQRDAQLALAHAVEREVRQVALDLEGGGADAAALHRVAHMVAHRRGNAERQVARDALGAGALQPGVRGPACRESVRRGRGRPRRRCASWRSTSPCSVGIGEARVGQPELRSRPACRASRRCARSAPRRSASSGTSGCSHRPGKTSAPSLMASRASPPRSLADSCSRGLAQPRPPRTAAGSRLGRLQRQVAQPGVDLVAGRLVERPVPARLQAVERCRAAPARPAARAAARRAAHGRRCAPACPGSSRSPAELAAGHRRRCASTARAGPAPGARPGSGRRRPGQRRRR